MSHIRRMLIRDTPADGCFFKERPFVTVDGTTSLLRPHTVQLSLTPVSCSLFVSEGLTHIEMNFISDTEDIEIVIDNTDISYRKAKTPVDISAFCHRGWATGQPRKT